MKDLSDKELMWTKDVKLAVLRMGMFSNYLICSHLVTKCSFRHKIALTSNQKTSFTRVVKKGVNRKEMSSKPLNI